MKDKFILDSSIWIELERKNPKIQKEVLPLLQKNKVCLVDAIIAEVLRGVRSQKDFNLLNETFSHFSILSTDWLKVSQLAFKVAKSGYTPPLIDIYIAQCTHEHKKHLITQDKDFMHIHKSLNFRFTIL